MVDLTCKWKHQNFFVETSVAKELALVILCYTKHSWCKKMEAKLEAPVTTTFLHATKRCDIR